MPDWRDDFRFGEVLYDHPDGLILCGDMADILPQFPENSIDCVITDLPYNLKDIHLYGLLAQHASRVMKDEAALLAIGGRADLPRTCNLLSDYLTYIWACGYAFNGPSPRLRGFSIQVTWRMALLYVKGARHRKHHVKGRCTKDMVYMPRDRGSEKKLLHKWQQSTFWSNYYVCELAAPETIVLDPFCGSGSTCISAKSWNRRFIGIDIDRCSAQTSAERVSTLF